MVINKDNYKPIAKALRILGKLDPMLPITKELVSNELTKYIKFSSYDIHYFITEYTKGKEEINVRELQIILNNKLNKDCLEHQGCDKVVYSFVCCLWRYYQSHQGINLDDLRINKKDYNQVIEYI